MIQVSNEFKKAIKQSERRIKGYVEVLYDLPSVSITPTTNMTSTYTPTSEISNGIRVENLYGSVDYLPLDGSYLTMDTTNTNIGFISDELFEDLTNPTITLSFSSTTVKGITMYFRNNTPTDMTINYSNGTSDTITNNENDIVQVIFDSSKTLTSVQAVINNVMYPDRKIYCMEIDLGITQVYKNQDLIEFTIDEEVNKLVEEVPINETNITLNNMTDLFNPLNPKGIVPYLSENTLIKPYIGVLTENLGVEYVKMGEFYFDSYTNNSDATTTLVGKNILKQIENDELTDGLVGCTSSFIDQPNGQSQNTTSAVLSRLGYLNEFNPREKISYYFQFLDNLNLMNYIKDITIHDYSIVYANRENKLIIRNPISNTVDSITKQELINDAQYIKLERINTLIKNDTRDITQGEQKDGTNTTIFSSSNAEFVLTKSPQNFAIKNEGIRNVWALELNRNFSYTGVSSAEIVYGSNNYTIVRATGTVGNTANFNCIYENHTIESKKAGQNYEITNKTSGQRKVALEINSVYNAYPGRVRTDLGQLEYAPSYEMRFDYNGDPSLEAGDYINVETPYGYKPLFIQKNRFKFDGGLEGSIEGVE